MKSWLTVKNHPHRNDSDEHWSCDEAKLAKDKFKELSKVHKKVMEIRMGGILHSTTEWEFSVENATEYVITESIFFFFTSD